MSSLTTDSAHVAELYEHVTKANLATVKFEKLFDKDEEEMRRLIQACETEGFFYLDLRSPGSEQLWKDLRDVDEATQRWFSQPTDVKLKTPTVSLAHG